MNFLDDKYKCREMLVTSNINNDMDFKINNVNNKYLLNENFIDIEMNSIKYSSSDELLICNLVKQNIQDEKMIISLHEYFEGLNVDNINFIIYNDSYDIFKELGYDLFSKSYIIRNDLF